MWAQGPLAGIPVPACALLERRGGIRSAKDSSTSLVGDDMKRSSFFVRGFLAGAGFVIAGVAAMTWGARAARAAWRRSPTAPNYAYLR
jgi:hypothetical protein